MRALSGRCAVAARCRIEQDVCTLPRGIMSSAVINLVARAGNTRRPTQHRAGGGTPGVPVATTALRGRITLHGVDAPVPVAGHMRVCASGLDYLPELRGGGDVRDPPRRRVRAVCGPCPAHCHLPPSLPPHHPTLSNVCASGVWVVSGFEVGVMPATSPQPRNHMGSAKRRVAPVAEAPQSAVLDSSDTTCDATSPPAPAGPDGAANFPTENAHHDRFNSPVHKAPVSSLSEAHHHRLRVRQVPAKWRDVG